MKSFFPISRAFGLLVLFLAVGLSSCTKDELVLPMDAATGEERTSLRNGPVIGGPHDGPLRSTHGATLRNGSDGDGEGGGISDDGDDQGDKERNNKKN